VKHFLKRLEKRLFGRETRRGIKLNRIVVIEGTRWLRPHVHLKIEKPHDLSEEDLKNCILAAWGKSALAGPKMDFKKCDKGWDAYLAKRRSKSDYSLSIDLENCHLTP
jgi:hypothetical protein